MHAHDHSNSIKIIHASNFPSSLSIDMPPQNVHFSLHRNMSSGRPVWWVDHGISSLRAEVILRRKMVYLQEEHDNAAAAASVTTASSSNIADLENYSSLDNGCVARELNDELPDTSSTTMMHHQCIDNSHCERDAEEGNENSIVTTSSKPAFLDDDNNNNMVTESFSAIKPQSPTEDGINNSTHHLHGFKRRDNATLNGGNDNDGVVAYEISLDDTNTSIPLPAHQSLIFDRQALIPSSQHHPDKIPMVQLSQNTAKQQRMYLDFGEGNIVGKVTHQQFRIVAPLNMEGCNDDGREFHVKLTKCLSRRGIRCISSLTTMEAHDSSYCDDTNIITLRMKRGESKTINVEWTPNDDGCMREEMDLEVTTSNGIHWQHSLVLVGEAHRAVDNDEEEEVVVMDDVVESKDSVMEKHVMISDITDTIVYSRDEGGDMSLEDECHHNRHAIPDGMKVEDVRKAHRAVDDDEAQLLVTDDVVESNALMALKRMVDGDALSLEAEQHQHVIPDGMKVEDDSMEYSLETNNSVLPKMDDEADKETMMLWNVNLSEIKEVGDNDTREELYLHSDIGCQFPQKVNEISVSLESGGGVVGQLAKFDDMNTFMKFSTIRRHEPSDDVITGDTDEMLHHFEEPREDGRPEQTNGAALPQHLAKNNETETFMEFSTIRSVEPSDDAIQRDTTELFHDLPEEPRNDGRAEQTTDGAMTPKYVEGSSRAIPHQDGATDQAVVFCAEAFEPIQAMGFCFDNWENKELAAAEKRANERLQSKQINDFEDLLRSEGLVETGETPADADTNDGQIELVMDINSSLINFVENMRSKSPSFGSLSSKESLDGHSSFSSTHSEDQPRRASLISTCLAEAQDHLANSPDDRSDDFDLRSEGESEQSAIAHPGNVDDREEPTMTFAQMMEQTSGVDSDNSFEAEWGNTKSELNALIDVISEMEEDVQMQHEYITSPSNLDFYSQLVNLNNHADGTTPLAGSNPTKFFQGNGRGSHSLSNDKPSRDPLSMVKLRIAAQRNSFSRPPNSATQERPESKECDLQKEPILKNRPQSQAKLEHGTPIDRSRVAFKTPHNNRLEKIASIRDKLSLIKINDTVTNGSTPHSADRSSRPTISTAVTPRGILMVNDLPNSTKASARKCYFYSSPMHDTKTKLPPTDIDSEQQPSPDNIANDKKRDEKENELHSHYAEKGQKSVDHAKITSLSLSHLRPREIKAQEKHIQSIREQKQMDNNSPLLNDRNPTKYGSSTPSRGAPSPRELRAYEKHIASMRERLNRAGLTYSSPDSFRKIGKDASPANGHMKRIGGVDSPIERCRWTS